MTGVFDQTGHRRVDGVASTHPWLLAVSLGVLASVIVFGAYREGALDTRRSTTGPKSAVFFHELVTRVRTPPIPLSTTRSKLCIGGGRLVHIEIRAEREFNWVFYHCFFGELVPLFAILQQLPTCDAVLLERNHHLDQKARRLSWGSCADLFDTTFLDVIANRSHVRVGSTTTGWEGPRLILAKAQSEEVGTAMRMFGATERYVSNGIDNLLTTCQRRDRNPQLPRMRLNFRHLLGETLRAAARSIRALCNCTTTNDGRSMIIVSLRSNGVTDRSRSGIPNQEAIVAEIRHVSRGYKVQVEDFANHTLCGQICLASSAQVLVGQHGSGLSYTALLDGRQGRPGLVELGGGPAQIGAVQRNMFYCIASLLGHNYRSIRMENDSAAVDPTTVAMAVDDVLREDDKMPRFMYAQTD
jgi:hypothetical protein